VGISRPSLGVNGHDYTRSCDDNGGDGGDGGDVNVHEVHRLLAERVSAKFARDFDTADALRAELRQVRSCRPSLTRRAASLVLCNMLQKWCCFSSECEVTPLCISAN